MLNMLTLDSDAGPGGTNTTSIIRPTGSVGGTLLSRLADPYVTITTFYDGGPLAVATLSDTTAASLAGNTGTVAFSTPVVYRTTTVG